MAQYVYSTLKPKAKFKVAEAEDIKFTDDKSVKQAIDDINDSISDIGDNLGKQEVYIGTEQPTDTSLVWFDTGDSEEDIVEGDVTVAELKEAIVEMNQTIQSLQSQIAQMQKDIDYLKENGGGGTTPSTKTIENAFISEDDYVLVDSDNNYISTI